MAKKKRKYSDEELNLVKDVNSLMNKHTKKGTPGRVKLRKTLYNKVANAKGLPRRTEVALSVLSSNIED